MPSVREVLDLVEEWYPQAYAEDWDTGIGLTCGDPAEPVERILLAVDVTPEVVDEAVAGRASLLLTHHPLLFRPVTSVAASTPKGAIVHRLVSHGCALYSAHTNADVPADGVSDALARTLGLVELRPLEPAESRLEKVVVFCPAGAAERVREAMTEAGAGAIGDYDSCTFTSTGEGRFRPLPGSVPAIGELGRLETVAEVRVESVVSPGRRVEVLRAMLAAHPYEVPAYDVIELAGLDSTERGTGRVGVLPEPTTLRGFAELVAERLPATRHGVRVSGDPDRSVRTVALVGGAGDGWLDDARRAGADVYLTSDLRHHPASEFRAYDGPALVDVAHWAAEWTWLPVLADKLTGRLGERVAVTVSTQNTDPWTFRL